MNDPFRTDHEDKTQTGRLYWAVMLSLGWLVYKLTAQPRYGLAITFAKLAWNDFLTGCWWFRRDPSWISGTSGLLLIWARGAAKYSLSLFGVLLVWEIVVTHVKANADDSWGTHIIVSVLAMGVWGVLGLSATLIAVISQTKLRIDEDFYDNRMANRFPPIASESNQAMLILMPSWLMGPLALGSVVTSILGPWPKGHVENAYVVSLYTLVVLLFFAGKSAVADSMEELRPVEEEDQRSDCELNQ